MWSTSCLQDPVLAHGGHGRSMGPSTKSFVVHAKVPLSNLVQDSAAFQEAGRPGKIALADFGSRVILDRFRRHQLGFSSNHGFQVDWEPLDYVGPSRRANKNKASGSQTPYVLERTDVWSLDEELNVMLRALVTLDLDETKMDTGSGDRNDIQNLLETETSNLLHKIFDAQALGMELMRHVACVVAQNRLRECLLQKEAVAFIADGSILPRKSGANNAPMASPPAVPSKAPEDSPLKQTLQVDLGALRKYLEKDVPLEQPESTMFSVPGMMIPKGITLVAGGGYHGKSTLLRAVAAGVYDKIPGDGREYCVTVPETLSIRAEDGRYVNNCNISAFISNLPTPPGVTGSIDTTRFSSGEASGSTSQAANVAEAIEMGAKVFLVDEDVSAANFMARDGRMRALVMDESITPLLYRVNGMYKSLGISCIVVVGGVGDWLDVPDQVILMNKYVASDATKKARSISKQFSHGHVQYAGRGVVHQLDWENSGTPLQRRPTTAFLESIEPNCTTVSLLDGGHAISVHPSSDHHRAGEDSAMTDGGLESDAIYNDDDDGYIDLHRCEQLVGKKPQLYGCGQCVIWLLREAKERPEIGVQGHLSKLEETIDKHGLLKVFADNAEAESLEKSVAWKHLLQASGFAYRPRKYEIGQALTRMRGLKMEHIPLEDDGEEERIRREAERRKEELAKMWAARRPKNVVAGQ